MTPYNRASSGGKSKSKKTGGRTYDTNHPGFSWDECGRGERKPTTYERAGGQADRKADRPTLPTVPRGVTIFKQTTVPVRSATNKQGIPPAHDG